MTRVLAVVLALAGAPAAVLPASLLHVHAYDDHVHSSHRHGPALHSHAADSGHGHEADFDPRSEEPGISACPPATHLMGLAAGCLAPASPAPVAVLVATVTVLDAPEAPSAIVGAADERAHGPPIDRHASPRAPPARSAA